MSAWARRFKSLLENLRCRFHLLVFIELSWRLKAEKILMNAEQIKDEIRKLSRIDKIEIYRWIDKQAAADIRSRIDVSGNRTEVQGDHSEKRVHFGLAQ